MVDNCDSFTDNLVHLFEELGAEVLVRQSDAISPGEAESLALSSRQAATTRPPN